MGVPIIAEFNLRGGKERELLKCQPWNVHKLLRGSEGSASRRFVKPAGLSKVIAHKCGLKKLLHFEIISFPINQCLSATLQKELNIIYTTDIIYQNKKEAVG